MLHKSFVIEDDASLRTILDNQAELDRGLSALGSGGALVSRLEAVEATLTRFGQSLGETQGAVSAEVRGLRMAEAELRGAIDDGLERLRTSAVTDDGPLEDVLDTILRRQRQPGGNDDTAVLAVRWGLR